MSIANRVRVESVRVLSDDWYVLRKATFAFQRNDGTWQTQSRESYDRGNGAAILLYDPDSRAVILGRQFPHTARAKAREDLLVSARYRPGGMPARGRRGAPSPSDGYATGASIFSTADPPPGPRRGGGPPG